MIPARAWIVPFLSIAILIAVCTRARADEPDCKVIRMYVAQHGKARALAWAIENGFSWQQIRAASRCLKEKN